MENTESKKSKRLKWNNRAIHRDLGYFFLGLVISFSLSGIVLNHRTGWNIDKYTVSEKDIFVDLSGKASFFSEENFAKDLAKELGINDRFRRLIVRKGQLSVSYASHRVEIDIKTGEGKITESKPTPVIGQITKLHRDNSKAWVWYSDIFAISMILIAITGVLLPKGIKGFRKRGWKVACAGIIFPVIVMIIII